MTERAARRDRVRRKESEMSEMEESKERGMPRMGTSVTQLER